MGTVRQTAVALTLGLLLAACQQAAAGPSPLLADPTTRPTASQPGGHGWQPPATTDPHAAGPSPTATGSPSGSAAPTTPISTSATPSPTPTGTLSTFPTSSPSPAATSSPSPTTSPSATPTGGGCPDARTCGEYDLYGGLWPAGPDGTITIRYRIRTEGWVQDPTGIHQAPEADEMIAMIRAAAQTWMDANPRMRLIYDGVTTDQPANGNNVIGWGRSATGTGYSIASAHHTPGPFGPTYTGFHVIIQDTSGWSWDTCAPTNGDPCTAEGQNEAPDFQGMITHEWGHVLGLDHPCWDGRCDADELTMRTGVPMRIRQTLALGDILGLRELYPTDAPMPVIYRP